MMQIQACIRSVGFLFVAVLSMLMFQEVWALLCRFQHEKGEGGQHLITSCIAKYVLLCISNLHGMCLWRITVLKF